MELCKLFSVILQSQICTFCDRKESNNRKETNLLTNLKSGYYTF